MALVCAPSIARADQCTVVDPDAADATVRLVTAGRVVDFCEPCGDPLPAPSSAVVASVVVRTEANGRKRVEIDGRDVDLAYVFVQTGKTTWTNVGLMVGCGAQKVSGFLMLKPVVVAKPPPPPPTKASPKPKCDPFYNMHGCK